MAYEKRRRERATRIVATIASNAEKPGALAALLDAGVDVVRLNGAHCQPGEIARRVALVRRVARARRAPTGVLLDLGGPKIRLGALPAGAVSLAAGRTVGLFPGAASAGESGAAVRLAVTYPALLADIGEGAEVRLDDGRIRLRVTKRAKGMLLATVEVGGRVRSGAGVNFPDSALSAPALTGKDRRDLAEGLAAGVDFVGLSFVRSPAHVVALRRLLARLPPERRPWIVSKIERKEALASLDGLAAASDALMVARGDLGVEIGLASVPRAQREILAAGRRHAVPVIVATQMLESMIENPTPTRAEVSDVAGAVHDGADAVMLSARPRSEPGPSRPSRRWPRSREPPRCRKPARCPTSRRHLRPEISPPSRRARPRRWPVTRARPRWWSIPSRGGRRASCRRIRSRIPVLAFTSARNGSAEARAAQGRHVLPRPSGAHRRGDASRRRRRPVAPAGPRRGGGRRDLGRRADGGGDEHPAREARAALSRRQRRAAFWWPSAPAPRPAYSRRVPGCPTRSAV